MKHMLVFLAVCLSYSNISSKNNQLLMFIHAYPSSFNDEEGMNVAHQMLTAFVQKAAPILVSENIWQHVVLRKDRFKQALTDPKSVQSNIVDLYHFTNQVIQESLGDVDLVNRYLQYDWYKKYYPNLAALDSNVLKHLMFDFFCYYSFEYIEKFAVYRLFEGYLLCIPEGMHDGFILKNVEKISHRFMEKPVFKKQSSDVDKVLKKYISPEKKRLWCFYLTGHGYHKDVDHSESVIAGMRLNTFRSLLKTLNNRTFKTQLLAYSSCYAAGEHSIVPYQEEIKGFKEDLILDYPVLMMSLTDAPTYVFGVPSGFKLPPYGQDTMLQSSNIYNKGLRFYFLQEFNTFCTCASTNKCTIQMARSLNPYIRCISSACDITKVENIPLIRQPHQTCFVPLDESVVRCLVKTEPKDIEVQNKAALLWYVKQYPGTIILLDKLPAFVSMIPGTQVHHGGVLKALGFDFQELIRALFLSIDDAHEQNIYLFDKITCSVKIDSISTKIIDGFEDVLILTAGKWLPVFAQQDASCYVYGKYNEQGYWISFNQHKQINIAIALNYEQQEIINRFKSLLIQESFFGKNLSVQKLLSVDYFEQRKALQYELFEQCLQQKICK